MAGKVRYWQETTDTEFYEMWPEPDRNRFDHLIIEDAVMVIDNSEEAIMQWEDDDDDS